MKLHSTNLHKKAQKSVTCRTSSIAWATERVWEVSTGCPSDNSSSSISSSENSSPDQSHNSNSQRKFCRRNTCVVAGKETSLLCFAIPCFCNRTLAQEQLQHKEVYRNCQTKGYLGMLFEQPSLLQGTFNASRYISLLHKVLADLFLGFFLWTSNNRTLHLSQITISKIGSPDTQVTLFRKSSSENTAKIRGSKSSKYRDLTAGLVEGAS